MTGEYFVSLKNYKIPLKSVNKSDHFDVNNPPPPGTEDEIPISNEIDSYVSPLALVNRSVDPAPAATSPPPPPPPITQSNPPSKTNKRSSLFSKSMSNCSQDISLELAGFNCVDLTTFQKKKKHVKKLNYEPKPDTLEGQDKFV